MPNRATRPHKLGLNVQCCTRNNARASNVLNHHDRVTSRIGIDFGEALVKLRLRLRADSGELREQLEEALVKIGRLEAARDELGGCRCRGGRAAFVIGGEGHV